MQQSQKGSYWSYSPNWGWGPCDSHKLTLANKHLDYFSGSHGLWKEVSCYFPFCFFFSYEGNVRCLLLVSYSVILILFSPLSLITAFCSFSHTGLVHQRGMELNLVHNWNHPLKHQCSIVTVVSLFLYMIQGFNCKSDFPPHSSGKPDLSCGSRFLEVILYI